MVDVTNLLLSLFWKNILKSLNIWQSYEDKLIASSMPCTRALYCWKMKNSYKIRRLLGRNCSNHRVITSQHSWRHRRLETKKWPPLKSINRIRRDWLLSRCDIQNSLWLVKQLATGWLINIPPPFFGFQVSRWLWPRPWCLNGMSCI